MSAYQSLNAYSAERFEGADQHEREALSKSLADEIQRRIQPRLKQVFDDVAEELSAAGHGISPELPWGPGEFLYSDMLEGGGTKLRVAFDIVISTGYRDRPS